MISEMVNIELSSRDKFFGMLKNVGMPLINVLFRAKRRDCDCFGHKTVVQRPLEGTMRVGQLPCTGPIVLGMGHQTRATIAISLSARVAFSEVPSNAFGTEHTISWPSERASLICP